MKYSTHRILSTGYIEVRQEKEDGTFHRHVIAPNQSIDNEPEDVQEAIKADPKYEEYHTEGNAKAYSTRQIYIPEHSTD